MNNVDWIQYILNQHPTWNHYRNAQRQYDLLVKSKCTWVENQDPDYWETSCGQSFTLIEGTLEDNHIQFCAFCGCKIVSQHISHMSDLFDELSEMSDEEYRNHLERKETAI